MSATLIIFGLVLLVLSYAILRNRFLILSQGLRLELARRGERLIANPALPPKQRDNVSEWLNSTFATWRVPIAAIFMPVLVLILFMRPDLRKDGADEIADDDTRREYRLVLFLSVSSDLLMSPLSAAIMLPQMLILTLFFVPIPQIVAGLERLLLGRVSMGHWMRNQGAH